MASCDRHRCIIDVDCVGNVVGVTYEAYLRGDRVAASTAVPEPFDNWSDVEACHWDHVEVMHGQGVLFP